MKCPRRYAKDVRIVSGGFIRYSEALGMISNKWMKAKGVSYKAGFNNKIHYRLDKFENWHCYGLYNIPKLVCLGYGSYPQSCIWKRESSRHWRWMLHAAPEAFMDDTTILCSEENVTHRMLFRLDALMSMSRMNFKPKKSGILSIKKGKLDKDVFFKVANQKLVKSLRR
ncbi:reverse transcriptase [Plakobranchus ocellatus]|uniref:Reverse transcriptase n=1 Tax=Plakobranchus ocellatus TaxID=259542 RepID=A0AAV4DGQ5_9GAST|nr:reverse transcriptase [Plakobranchus ocellatus]